MKKALICGISGQDGAYLAQLLLSKGYSVCGTSRDAQISSFQNLMGLGIREQVKLESMALTDFRSVLQILTNIDPDEVYNLAGQSSVGLFFEQQVETLESIATGISHKLEDFVATAFAELNLDWGEHLIVDESLFRPTDIQLGSGNPTKARQKLGWQARYQMRDTIRMMIQAKAQLPAVI